VSISGSVSSHQSNTRSTDNSAKYHVDVRAANHGTPEGLSRVLDILSVAAAPTLMASKMVDANGNEADAATKEKRANLQASYENQQRLGTVCKAASEQYEAAIKGTQDSAQSFLTSQKMNVQTKLNEIVDKKEDDDATKKANDENRAKYMGFLQGLDNSWNRVKNDVRMTVEALYAKKSNEVKSEKAAGADTANAAGGAGGANSTNGTGDAKDTDITTLFTMKKVKDDYTDLDKVATTDIVAIQSYFDRAIQNYKDFKEQEKSLADERANYNALLMKR
jgi:hypothetical protein